MIPISVFIIVMSTGIYFIWRSERKSKKGKIVEMRELDDFEKEISK